MQTIHCDNWDVTEMGVDTYEDHDTDKKYAADEGQSVST